MSDASANRGNWLNFIDHKDLEQFGGPIQKSFLANCYVFRYHLEVQSVCIDFLLLLLPGSTRSSTALPPVANVS